MKRKAVSCLLILAALITMTPTIPTMAAENQDNETQSTQTTTEAWTQNSVVKYDQASAFTVTIPKSIALSSSKSAEYTVRVQGDVIGNEIITVTPDASVILSDSNGKDPVTGDITQEKTEFSSTEVNARSGGGTATGSILANNLTSGDWSGNFKFVIGTNQIGNGTAITSENLATYGIETTGDVVIPEYVTDDDNTRHAVTGIGDYAFRDCDEMTSVAIADSVTEIGTGAFVSCSKLSKAAVPNSVRSIGNSAFDGCTSLSSISYNGNEYDLSNIEPAFVENGVSVGSHVFDHTYSEPVYTWFENNSACTATKTCSECHDVVTETVESNKQTVDSTCTNEGLNTYTATFKNLDFETQTKTSKISAKGHKSVSANNAVAATCTTDGKESDTVCSVCGVTLATGKTITKTGHKYGTPTYTWSKDKATCTAERTCSVCSDRQTDTVNATSKVTKAATCTGAGVKTYTAKFTNTAFATQTTTSSISAVGHKSVSANNAVAATCTTDGKESDTVCSVCGVTLATGKTITKTGHKYGTPTYTWSKDGKTCVAKRVCANDSTHIETENGTITNKVKTPATCTVKGTRTYTATFKNTAFKTQTKDIQNIAALEHKYGTPTYTWSEDGQTCTAKRVCTNNTSHIETEEATITHSVKTEATCTSKGTTTYTATFKNTAFVTQTKDIQNIAALGHNPIAGSCTRCKERIAGLYGGSDRSLLCSWKDSGIKDDCSNAADIIKNNYASTEIVIIPKGITNIANSAFLYCSSIQYVSIPEGVTSIGNMAFMSCNLPGIYIPTTVTTIGYNAFYGNHNMRSITIPENVTTIGMRLVDLNSGIKAYFKNTTGWYRLPQINSETGIAIDSTDLADPSKAARILAADNSMYPYIGRR